jgi:hypothetical protein
MAASTPTEQHLQRYLAERLPQLTPGVFDGAFDYPDFTVDQRDVPLQQPPYTQA